MHDAEASHFVCYFFRSHNKNTCCTLQVIFQETLFDTVYANTHAQSLSYAHNIDFFFYKWCATICKEKSTSVTPVTLNTVKKSINNEVKVSIIIFNLGSIFPLFSHHAELNKPRPPF